jgi:2-polyprenyl-3-methyl-5-hydroxy-6-metoxy-1,4-benzoquinol methylase
MQDLYNEEYYKNNLGPIPCTWDDPTWRNHVGNIAKEFVQLYNPKTFIDAGCGIGLLVDEMEKRGVESYGFDISEYGVSVAQENGLNCVTATLPHVPKDWQADLVSCIEVLEHLNQEQAEASVASICGMAKEYIVFSSTPDDTTEASHHCVKPEEFWTKLFEQQKFLKIDTAKYIAPHAIVFQRKPW